MLYLRMASASIENRPDREEINDIDNFVGVVCGRNWQELAENMVEAMNDEAIITINNWAMITGESEESAVSY